MLNKHGETESQNMKEEFCKRVNQNYTDTVQHLLGDCSCVCDYVYTVYSFMQTGISLCFTQHAYGFIRSINALKNVTERADEERCVQQWKERNSYNWEYHGAFTVL